MKRLQKTNTLLRSKWPGSTKAACPKLYPLPHTCAHTRISTPTCARPNPQERFLSRPPPSPHTPDASGSAQGLDNSCTRYPAASRRRRTIAAAPTARRRARPRHAEDGQTDDRPHAGQSGAEAQNPPAGGSVDEQGECKRKHVVGGTHLAGDREIGSSSAAVQHPAAEHTQQPGRS